MTTVIKKHSPPKKEISKFESRNSKFVFVIIAILTCIPFLLGKYFELNYPDPFDSGMNVYSAKHILDGAHIGVDEIPSAQMGTLLVNILGVWLGGFNETGPKVIQGFLQVAALVLMFIAVRKLFGIFSAAVSVIVASVYLSAPVIAKFGNVKEQYMIACMVIGISCFVLYQLSSRWWWAVLAGIFLIWAPLFKETGMSAIGAVGLFVIAQPILKNRTFNQTVFDILLLLAGAVLALAPLYIWILVWDVKQPLPYSFVWSTVVKMLPAKAASDAAATADYVSESRKAVSLTEQAPMVFRYYKMLILPIALAICSIIARLVKLVLRCASCVVRRASTESATCGLVRSTQYAPRTAMAAEATTYDRFVLLFAVWWLLDMAFVWISPRPYEQYYLPLNGSAAMLGGYLIAVYCDKLKTSSNKILWRTTGLMGLLIMIAMSWGIFFGIKTSPATGADYGERRRGYVQKWNEISQLKRSNFRGYWEIVGDYIRQHSEPTDKIYVWGWIPGIYVRAQRFSPVPSACTSEMHVNPPAVLSAMVSDLLSTFQKEPPKFIVDTHNKHFPYDRRPPLQLWPTIGNGLRLLDDLPKEKERLLAVLFQTFDVKPIDLTKDGFLRQDSPAAIEKYEAAYAKTLREKVEPDEALRFEAMKPLRDYIMKNYHIAQVFGDEVVFELNTVTPSKPR